MHKTDRWIIGTGFSRGIGSEIAKKMHEKGYRILHIGRKKGAFDDEFIHCDLSHSVSSEFINKLRLELENKVVHGFLYAAGVIPELVCGHSPEETATFWKSHETALHVNYISCVAIAHEILPFALKSKKVDSSQTPPFLAHIASLAAVDPLPNLEFYGITKLSTLKHFSYLAKQYAPNELAFLAIHPGTVRTDMFDSLLKSEYASLPIFDALKQEMESKNVISPEQSAKLIVKFLLDDSGQDARKSAHGKIYAVDSQQIYENL